MGLLRRTLACGGRPSTATRLVANSYSGMGRFLFRDGKDAIGSAIGQRNSRANTTGLAWADRAVATEFGRIAFFGVEPT
jgi:hypothetical protein